MSKWHLIYQGVATIFMVFHVNEKQRLLDILKMRHILIQATCCEKVSEGN